MNPSPSTAPGEKAVRTPRQRRATQLYLLIAVEVCERYSFYTMQGILVLYMTISLDFSEQKAYAEYASFSALLFLAPIVGGHIADHYLPIRSTIILGGLLLSAGYGLLALPAIDFLYLGLGFVVVGGGLFIPNMAAMVGSLYADDDVGRDAAFSLFYAGINVGAFAPLIVAGWIVANHGWSAAFLTAGLAVLLGTAILLFGWRGGAARHESARGPIWRAGLRRLPFAATVFALVILAIFATSKLMTFAGVTHTVLILTSLALVAFFVRLALVFDRIARNRLLFCLLLTLCSIVYVVLDQQAAMSLTIFTEYNVQRRIYDFEIPTVSYRALNPLFVILLGPLLAVLWSSLGRGGITPSVPAKFGIGTMVMGSAFVLLSLAIVGFASSGVISSSWIAGNYFLQAAGELLVAPIGLSTIIRLAPANMTGLMMGTWYFAGAVANTLAGSISQWAAVPDAANLPHLTAAAYASVFGGLGFGAVAVGVVMVFFARRLNRLAQA